MMSRPARSGEGNTPTDDEAKAKGQWAATAQEGVVPAPDDGGSDAPSELQAEDPAARELSPGHHDGVR